MASYQSGVQLINHKGRVNVGFVLDWLQGQDTGFQDSPPDVVVTLGFSAGAMAAKYHAPHIMQVFPQAKHVVLADSFVGLLAQGHFDGAMTNWGLQAAFDATNFVTGISDVDLSTFSRVDMFLHSYLLLVANHYPSARLFEFTFDQGQRSLACGPFANH